MLLGLMSCAAVAVAAAGEGHGAECLSLIGFGKGCCVGFAPAVLGAANPDICADKA